MLSKVGISQVFQQIDRFVERYGAEGIAIGSNMWGYDGVCEGFNDPSDFHRLAKMLDAAGYPDPAVEGIMGGELVPLLFPATGRITCGGWANGVIFSLRKSDFVGLIGKVTSRGGQRPSATAAEATC